MSKKYQKGRFWATVAYPESLPKDWEESMQQEGLNIAVSPLHDKDLNPDGEEKKKHYHFIFKFEGPTTYEHVKKICDKYNMTIPIKLESLRGMYRYHTHRDNPEKYQYDEKERIFIGNFNPKEVEKLSEFDVDKITTDILIFIDDNNITEYCDLLRIIRESELNEMLDIAKRHTILFNTYIKSKRHKQKELTEYKKNSILK